MTPSEISESLHARVRAFITQSLSGPAPETSETFDALALAIARFQAHAIPAIARLTRARGVHLDAERGAGAIAAVPCDVFRLTRVAAHPSHQDERVFRTSGTSLGAASRGEHPMRTTATYAMGALAWGRAMLWPDRDRLRCLVLAPSLQESPDSSLSFMLDRFAAHLGGQASFHVRKGALDIAGFVQDCALARETGEPALVLGTSFAWVHLLDATAGQDLTLPERSRAMLTGGFKGRSREVSPGELRQAIARALGVEDSHVVGEYGMTELSSQLYEPVLARAVRAGGHGGTATSSGAAGAGIYLAPPWVRVTAVDASTMMPVRFGEIGLARIVDLANVDSAVAIQTSDRVRIVEGSGVELLGRAQGALPRGCSIAMDEMLSGERL